MNFGKMVRKQGALLVPDACSDLIDSLIELRKSKGWTQRDLSLACGMSQPVIARIESKRVAPSIATFQKIAAALGATLSLVV